MTLAYLGLGSNQGDRRALMSAAVRAIQVWPEARTLAVSSLYESVFIGPGVQPPYLNACLQLDTDAEPHDLLTLGHGLEGRAGRAPRTHLRPRPLDVDVLLYGDLQIETELLVVPHPRLIRRRFVLEPLVELGVEQIPGCAQTATELMKTEDIRAQGLHWVEGDGWWEMEAA